MSDETTSIENELKKGNKFISFTKGTSMEPLLYEGKTYVVLSPLHHELKIGDIPVFKRNDGKYILHRLIKIEDGFCYTRGDNCIGMEKVPVEKMLGVVTEICRNGKTIRMTDTKYQIYRNIWMHSFPLRLVFYQIRSQLLHLKMRILNK